MEYLKWDEKNIGTENASDMYDRGYVFTRIDLGVMQQTRSVRISLAEYEASSENRRILRKGEEAKVTFTSHIIPYSDYSWEIAKLAKDFYDKKAGGAFTANKIKELIETGENFNKLLEFKIADKTVGYAICYENADLIHYSYPFYDLDAVANGVIPKDIGLIMMNMAIADAKARGLSYVYLGSLQRPTDTYKLQFKGLEWFDGETKTWSSDIKKATEIIK